MKENKVVEIKNLVKSYGARGFQTKVLKGIDLTILKMILSLSWGQVVQGRQPY